MNEDKNDFQEEIDIISKTIEKNILLSMEESNEFDENYCTKCQIKSNILRLIIYKR